MRWSVALLFLTPILGMASLIEPYPRVQGYSSYGVTNTIVGNVVTIELFGASEVGQALNLDETLLIGPVTSSESFGEVGLVNLTFLAGAEGFASVYGTLGEIASCGANSSVFPGPDTFPVVNHCYDTALTVRFPSSGLIPVNMQMQLGNGSGDVYLQAAFSDWNLITNEIRPLSVQFWTPEPGTLTLWTLGLASLVVLRHGKWALRARRG